MPSSIGVSLLLILGLRIAITDYKTHYIKNIDLLFTLLIIMLFLDFNILFGILNLAIYLALYILTKRQLGFGDVKLSFLIGLGFLTFPDLLLALNIAWISGGVWAIISNQRQIAFAPWMLAGALISHILMN